MREDPAPIRAVAQPFRSTAIPGCAVYAPAQHARKHRVNVSVAQPFLAVRCMPHDSMIGNTGKRSQPLRLAALGCTQSTYPSHSQEWLCYCFAALDHRHCSMELTKPAFTGLFSIYRQILSPSAGVLTQ